MKRPIVEGIIVSVTNTFVVEKQKSKEKEWISDTFKVRAQHLNRGSKGPPNCERRLCFVTTHYGKGVVNQERRP